MRFLLVDRVHCSGFAACAVMGQAQVIAGGAGIPAR